jgi:hypothetical protein
MMGLEPTYEAVDAFFTPYFAATCHLWMIISMLFIKRLKQPVLKYLNILVKKQKIYF